jgi:hypothetical protein
LWDATRNRPAHLASSAPKVRDPQEQERLRSFMESSGPALMDPLEAGRLVLRGIRNNDLYILTHPEIEQGMQERHEALMASIPRDLNPPPERVAAERAILSNPIYVAERDRKRQEQNP